MKVSKLAAMLVLGFLAGSAGPGRAQSEYQKKVEEYNAYVETAQAKDPNERLAAIERFLKSYPQSQYRVFVYPSYADTAWQLKQYAAVMKAVDGFWGLGREQVTKVYRDSNPNVTDLQIDGAYFQAGLLYTYSFLQSFRDGTPESDAIAARAAERAREGLELHKKLYSQVPVPTDEAQRKQFEAQKQQQEAAFHGVLAVVAWRSKDFAAAAREYMTLVTFSPEDPASNYRLGLALLQKQPPDYQHGFWHLARAIGLNVPKSDDVRGYLTNAVAAYQQAVPACVADQVDDLIADSVKSVHPPAGWSIVGREQVEATRREVTNVKRIFDDLQAGGDKAHVMWLASCGTEIGVGEGGQPEMWVLVLEATQSPDNLVTLQVAAGQEAVEAKAANLEVKVEAPPEAKNLKAGDEVRVAGKLSEFQNEPAFLLKLTEGKVNAEDLPKAAPTRRGRGGGAR